MLERQSGKTPFTKWLVWFLLYGPTMWLCSGLNVMGLLTISIELVLVEAGNLTISIESVLVEAGNSVNKEFWLQVSRCSTLL